MLTLDDNPDDQDGNTSGVGIILAVVAVIMIVTVVALFFMHDVPTFQDNNGSATLTVPNGVQLNNSK